MKRIIPGLLCAVMLMSGAAWAAEDNAPASTPASASTDSATSTADQRAFKSFYKELMGLGMLIDNAYKPFNNAITKQEYTSALQIANREFLSMTENANSIRDLAVPSLKNAAAERELRKAGQLITDAYAIRVASLATFIMMIEDPATTEQGMVRFKKQADTFIELLLDGFERFYGVARCLGIKSALHS